MPQPAVVCQARNVTCTVALRKTRSKSFDSFAPVW